MNKAETIDVTNRDKAVYSNQLVTVEHLARLKEELLDEFKKMLTAASGGPAKRWLKSADVRKLLGLSPGTLQQLRINGTIPFAKLGSILYYDYQEIQRILVTSRK